MRKRCRYRDGLLEIQVLWVSHVLMPWPRRMVSYSAWSGIWSTLEIDFIMYEILSEATEVDLVCIRSGEH